MLALRNGARAGGEPRAIDGWEAGVRLFDPQSAKLLLKSRTALGTAIEIYVTAGKGNSHAKIVHAPIRHFVSV